MATKKKTAELERLVDLIAGDLVMVAVDDLPELAKLHDSFMKLAGSINDGSSTAASVARNCADHVERIMLDDVEDKDAAISLLKEAVVGLQAVIRDGRNPDDVTFPEALVTGKAPAKEAAPKDPSRPQPKESQNRIAPAVPQEDMIISLEGNDTTLLGDFITEAREHCTTAEQMLMDLETDTANKAAIDAIFRSFHTIKGAAGFLELKPIGHLAHESETLLDMARTGTIVIQGVVADTIFESIDAMRTLLDGLEMVLSSGGTYDGTAVISALLEKIRGLIEGNGVIEDQNEFESETPKRLGEVLVDMGAVSRTELEDALQNKSSTGEKVGETLVRQGKVSPKAVVHALRDQQRARVKTATVREMVKIDTERLDRLVDTIGELVIAESMVGQDEEILTLASSKVSRNLSHLNKITRELQEMGMAMRLVPVKATFQKLSRAVRDLARKSGKNVSLEMSGEDAEVDRSIVESIGDPLMHMIRNSIDHGLETTEDRIRAGKSETGHLWIRAYHKGGNIYLEIEDDGKGLDKEKIVAKAREKGLITGAKDLTEKEIFNLILLPGFSTAAKVTDISGRGVGMDVVKKNIESMRGLLEIESVAGQGTKFSIRLPLTLAIIDGMLVSVGETQFIIPTLSVEKSLRLTPDMVNTVNDRYRMINLRGSIIPLFRIRDLFDLPMTEGEMADSTVVIVDDSERRVGLVVDQLLGQRQTVIKSLGPIFQKQKWISGGAILSSGNVGLIIDTSGIIEMAGMCKAEIDRIVSESSIDDAAKGEPGTDSGVRHPEAVIQY